LGVIQLLGSTLGLGLVSGINLYATVLVVGLGIRFGVIVLRPELHQLDVLANPVVIVIAGLIFVVEFLADKIKWIDSLWDAVHTFIRPLGAALIGAAAFGEVSPESVVIALLCGGVALSGHSTKAGLRLLVNHSPEPFSNVALSLIEDVLVVLGTYVAVQYPYVMLIIVTLFVIAFVWFAPKAFRLLRIEANAIVAILKKLFLKLKGLFMRNRARGASSESHESTLQSSNTSKLPQISNDEMPIEYAYHLRHEFDVGDHAVVIKCVAGKGVPGLRHSIGYLNITSTEAIFMCKRLLRLRHYAVPRDKIEHVYFKQHLLMDRLTLRISGKQHVFYLFKDVYNRGEMISRVLCWKECDLGNDSTNQTHGTPIKLVPVSQTENGKH
jgi:Domain of unknown function (DUF4126)